MHLCQGLMSIIQLCNCELLNRKLACEPGEMCGEQCVYGVSQQFLGSGSWLMQIEKSVRVLLFLFTETNNHK